MFFWASALALLAWSSAISSSLMSASSFFFMRRASALPLASASSEACIESRARWWFLRVFSNSSSFSWMRRSISWRTCDSSSCARSTLFSSCSRAASASSRAACSSSFSASRRLRDFSIS
uniref:Putative secreted protein n=1 Tax=Anopheles darlingi TaxID=43151 RepID=A0A2M4D1R7_ANODA